MIKICEECGKPFETNRSRSRWCSEKHFRNCIVCGKEFELSRQQLVDNKRCCCSECGNIFNHKQAKERLSKTIRICKECGKPFVPTNNNQQYCTEEHYRPCPVCGKPVKVIHAGDLKNNKSRTCSAECTNRLISQKLKQPPKYRKCVVCGKEFEVKRGYKAVTCSKQCTGIYCKQTGIASRRYAKAVQTNLQRYGVENVGQLEFVHEKMGDTLEKRIGVRHPMQSKEYLTKAYETTFSHFGVLHPSQSPKVQEKFKHTMLEKYGMENPMQVKEIWEKASQTRQEKYGYSVISKTNKDFHDLLLKCGINSEYEFYLDGKYYDLQVRKILIEINPTYTHNEIGNHWSGKGKDKFYHLSKSELALIHGFRCIHIFDWDDIDKIVDMLTIKQHIGARNCIVKEITDGDIVNTFLNLYHLQGSCRGQIKCYGTYYRDNLISMMTFGKPRYNKKYEWELLRLCTDKRYRVLGGASKMFKYFVSDCNPKNVISYCDRSKFIGSVYQELDMTLLYNTPPAKVWSKGHKRVTDNLLRQRGFDQLFGTNYGKGTSNEQLMLEHGWLPVYDCGQAVYAWKGNTDGKENL